METVKVSAVAYADRVRLLRDTRSAACERLVNARKQVIEAERIIAEADRVISETTLALGMLEGLQDAPKEAPKE